MAMNTLADANYKENLFSQPSQYLNTIPAPDYNRSLSHIGLNIDKTFYLLMACRELQVCIQTSFCDAKRLQ